jgi:hypothetical protein
MKYIQAVAHKCHITVVSFKAMTSRTIFSCPQLVIQETVSDFSNNVNLKETVAIRIIFEITQCF